MQVHRKSNVIPESSEPVMVGINSSLNTTLRCKSQIPLTQLPHKGRGIEELESSLLSSRQSLLHDIDIQIETYLRKSHFRGQVENFHPVNSHIKLSSKKSLGTILHGCDIILSKQSESQESKCKMKDETLFYAKQRTPIMKFELSTVLTDDFNVFELDAASHGNSLYAFMAYLFHFYQMEEKYFDKQRYLSFVWNIQQK